MENNDILRRLRFILGYKDAQMIEVFGLANHKVSWTELNGWLKKTNDPNCLELSDKILATFLNGLIVEKRGKREGAEPVAENRLNNNILLIKIKIAFNLKNDDIIELFSLINKRISAHELSAFFRSPEHSKYRPCNDQYFRNFLDGMQKKYQNQ